MSGDHDLWYVKTADGDVDRMTLDQLDEAFNAGHIDENVTVLPAGQSNWVRLGTLLGLDQPATTPPVSFAPVPSYAPVPNSMRPVSIDLGEDQEFAPRKSRKGIGTVAVAAVLLIPAGILGANHMHLGSTSVDSNVAAAAMQAPPPVAAAPPPPAPTPPAPTPPATTATARASADNRLTDDQKAKLAAADKVLDAKIKAKQKARISGGRHHSSPKYQSQGFTSGGNKFDPLNSGI
jgi:hypothetical protein